MSFWDKVKSAGNAAAQAASDAAAATKKAINDLQSYPTAVMCAGCQGTVPVPASAWDWTCAKAECAKVNTSANATNACADCKTAKPKVPNPKVTCAKCNTVAVVPFSSAGRLLDDAKTVVVHTGKSAKKEFEYLQEKPSQFNCEHCQTLLGVPAPVPWTCTAPNCKTQNPADSAACAGCAAAKPQTAGMVLCGVCNKATKVPTSNFWVKAKAEYAAAEKSIKKLYLDVASKPYILCPRCQTPLHVDMKKHQQQQAAAAAAAGKTAAADGKVDKPAAAAGASAGAAAGAAAGAGAGAGAGAEGGEGVSGKASAGQSAPVPAPAVAEPAGLEVVCTKCSERLLVAVGASAEGAPAGAGAGAAAGAPAPNAAAPPASN